ncbi:MAG: alpha-xylosidase [Treponema sp.]|jgi:alpha-D-xyloside xylohydrolase|nr:alpha-xylosidase [Treponema sp.]
MKFTNGYWLLKEGLEPHFAAQAYEAEQQEDCLVVYAPDRPVISRGDTLNRPLLTLRYSSPMENIIRVRVSHFEGAIDQGPRFELGSKQGLQPEIRIGAEEAELTSGALSVHIPLGRDWDVSFRADGRRLTGSGSRSTAYITDSALAAGTGPFIKEELSLGVGELVYGLGERFGPFVKNGQTVDIWNADGGTASEQAYKNIPFYLTNKGYGVLVNECGRVSFEIATEKTNRSQFSVAGESLEYFIIYGPNPKAILERYTALSGRPPMLPEWSFGLWLSTSFTTSYDEKTVIGFVDGMLERGIPLKVFHFDCFWMKGFHWSDFTWDPDTFPDPRGMISRIKAKGLRVCVWINPYIAQRSALFAEGRAKGYFIRKADGSVWQTDLWQAGMGVVDFSNPEAAAWFQGKLETLLDMGVDCFKTDFGERIPEDGVYFDGGDPAKHHNYYTYRYNKTVFELLERKRGKGEAVLFARSATTGNQKFPLHWGGDCESSFEAMAETLRGGLSLGLSGFGYWSHDIGGFEGTPGAALFKRWLAFGLLSSHSRLHGSNSYRAPWNVDQDEGPEGASAVCKFFARLKERLNPYLLDTAKEAHEQGTPMLRAMFLEFPDDPACAWLDRQYMLGPALLVAPVFSEDNTVEYYLPPGRWTHLIDTAEGKPRAETGGKWIRERCGFLSLPAWVRSAEGLSPDMSRFFRDEA